MSLPTCYFTQKNNIIVGYPWVPCGPPSSTGFVQCCSLGDTCGLDGFCHYTHALDGGSGYYLAGCTDPTNKDPSCPLQCSDQGPDVVYSSTTNLWSCCYDKPLNCSPPTNTTFKAPDPKVLFASPFSILTATGGSTSTQSSTQGTATSQSTTAPTVMVTVTATSSADSSSTPSFGAGIGVGIAVAFVAIACIGALLFWLLRSRRRPQEPEQQYQQQPHYQPDPSQIPTRSTTVWSPNEAEKLERAAELSYNWKKKPAELPHNGTSAELA